MIVILVFLAARMLIRNCRVFSNKERAVISTVTVGYLLALIYYTSYIDAQPFSFGYGIPQADMLAHYKGAQAISQGQNWNQLSSIASRYESVGIGTIGYFIYASFLSICVFTLGVFDPGINVFLVYVLQMILSIDACVRYGRFYSAVIPKSKVFVATIVLITCAPYAIQAFQLMRDVYYMWLIALLLEKVVSQKTIKSESALQGGNPRKQFLDIITGRKAALVLIAALCVLLRVYSLMVFLPLVLYYTSHRKGALAVAGALSLVLAVGSGAIDILRQVVGVTWTLSAPNIVECVSFLLFPNIFNQTEYLLHWDQYFYAGIDISGCNVPGVYFAMALWNVVVIPMALVGVVESFKKNKYECITWLLILINVLMLYSVSYDSIDTRHKFFMSIPICFFAVCGYVKIRSFDNRLILFFGSIVLLLMAILVIIYL